MGNDPLNLADPSGRVAAKVASVARNVTSSAGNAVISSANAMERRDRLHGRKRGMVEQLLEGGGGGHGYGGGPTQSSRLPKASGAINGPTTVIGRIRDLKNLKLGEKSLLDRLPDRGSPQANWKQNSGVLRQEMNRGRPIRDASPGEAKGQFLNAERNLLRSQGWTFDPNTKYWMPPK